MATFFLFIAIVYAHEWMAPKKDATVKNPLEKTEQVLRTGQEAFYEFCMGCHGKDAKGLPTSVTGLERRPPDLLKTIKSHSDGDFFWKIKIGRKEMPSFKDDLEQDEIWSIVHFIRSIQKNEKSKDKFSK